MAAIADVAGGGAGQVGLAVRRAFIAPTATGSKVGRPTPTSAKPAREIDQSLGRLSAAREHRFVDARQARQTDHKLSELVKQLAESGTRLDQVKLYPPYPPNESRRAAAIREFNGIAAEVRQLAADGVVSGIRLPNLRPDASTGSAEAAVSSLHDAVVALSTQRAASASGALAGDGKVAAASAEVGRALAATDQGLTRSGGDLLRGL